MSYTSDKYLFPFTNIFPSVKGTGTYSSVNSTGLTKREYFASLFFCAHIINSQNNNLDLHETSIEDAITLADKFINKLEK